MGYGQHVVWTLDKLAVSASITTHTGGFNVEAIWSRLYKYYMAPGTVLYNAYIYNRRCTEGNGLV